MTARPTVADLVYTGLRRIDAARDRLHSCRDRDQVDEAGYRRALAALYTREARWWAVLSRATIGDHSVPLVYITAVSMAHSAARQEAHYWARPDDTDLAGRVG